METDEVISAPSALTPRRLVVILRRQWWVVIACLVLAGGGAFAYTRSQGTRYSATATIATGSQVAGSSGTPSVTLPSITNELRAVAVTSAAARAAGPSNDVTLRVDTNGDSIDLTATGHDGPAVARAARAAATALVTQRVADIQAQAAHLNDAITPLTARLNQLDPAGSKPNGATQVLITALRGQLTSLVQQQDEFQTAAYSVSLSTNNTPPFTSASGDGKKVIELALVAGLLIGCGVALILDQLDDRLRSVAELPEIGNVRLLAELPTRTVARRSDPIVGNAHDELSEAVRELRTALRFLSVERPIRTLLVTSPAAGEGKSFVAANLAMAFALSGVRTVLVSSDLRRPQVETLLRAGRSSLGLSDAIVDGALRERRNGTTGAAERPGGGSRVDVADLLLPTGVDDFWLLPAGASPPNPAELLGSRHMTAVMGGLKRLADVVILDSPPVLAVTDALVLTAHADGVVLVVSKGKSSRGAARRALRLLESGLAPVFGVVVNRSSRDDLVPYPYFEEDQGGAPWRRMRRRSSSSSPVDQAAEPVPPTG